MPFDLALLTRSPSDAPQDAKIPLPEAFIESLTGSALEAAWNDIIDDWTWASDDEVMAARHFIGTVRDRIVEGVSDTEDDAEFQTAALLAFTRLKAFWFELNSRLGYHLDPESMGFSFPLRAGLVAALLGAMEPHLPARSVEKVDAFLSAVVADDMESDPPASRSHLPGPAEVRKKIADLLGTIQTLSERVVRQEGELIELRTGHDALQAAFGTSVSATEIAAQLNALTATVTALEAQSGMEEIYRNVLYQALGTTDPLQIVREVRELRDAVKQSETAMLAAQVQNEQVAARFGTNLSAGDALHRLRDAERAAITSNAEIVSLQSRLAEQAGRAEQMMHERNELLRLLHAPDLQAATETVNTLHENAAAYRDIAALLGDVGGKLPGF